MFYLLRTLKPHLCFAPPLREKQLEEEKKNRDGRNVYRVDVCPEDTLHSAELMMNWILEGGGCEADLVLDPPPGSPTCVAVS